MQRLPVPHVARVGPLAVDPMTVEWGRPDAVVKCPWECGCKACTQPSPEPLATVEEERECPICQEPIECDGNCNDGYYSPDGDGCRCGPPAHCCLCGGSPYCNCCPKCKQCIAQCGCPIAMKLNDGSEVLL